MKDNGHLVSVIIPAFNSGETLSSTLSSIFGQTYRNIEVIVVDDGSLDNTADIVSSYMTREPRLSYFRKENGGPSSARNYGIEHSSGEYCLFVDSDDSLRNDAIECMISNALSSSSDIVVFDFKTNSSLVGRNDIVKKPFPESFVGNSNDFLEALFHGQIGNFMWAFLFRSSIFRFEGIKFPEDISLMEDAVILNEIVSSSRTISFINDSLYVYNIREESVSRSVSPESLNSGFSAISRISNSPVEASLLTSKMKYLLHLCLYLYRQSLRYFNMHRYRVRVIKFVNNLFCHLSTSNLNGKIIIKIVIFNIICLLY